MIKILHKESQELLNEAIKNKKVQEQLLKLREHETGTYDHSVRVDLLNTDLACCAIDLGFEIQLDEQQLMMVAYSGLFHDIGKLDISRQILCKQGKLAPGEKDITKQHPRLGFHRIGAMGLGEIGDKVKKIVVGCHEFQDDPYPRTGNNRRSPWEPERRVYSDEIYKMTEILAISDMADALAHPRPYRPAYPRSRVESIMRIPLPAIMFI